jgi:hypothetical protein
LVPTQAEKYENRFISMLCSAGGHILATLATAASAAQKLNIMLSRMTGATL